MKDTGLDLFYARESSRRPLFAGQLEASFQQALVDRFSNVAESDCAFAESVDLPGGRSVEGDIDLRGAEEAFVGGVKLWGKRVLQVFPRSGWLSSHLAVRADELVVLDLPPGFDLDAADAQGAEPARRERIAASWWFVKNALGFEAQAVYADPYDPPEDLGRFDVAVLAHVLSGVAHPYLALRRAAAVTDDTIVVTERLPPGASADIGDAQAPSVLFVPPASAGGAPRWVHAPAAVARMLKTLGFPEQAASVHAAREGHSPVPHFTIVARRERAGSGAALAAWVRAAAPQAAVRRGPGQAAPAPAAHAAAGGPSVAPAVQAMPPPSGPVQNTWDSGAVDELPLPTAMGRFLVAGTDDVEVFVTLGRNGFQALMSSLGRAGVPAASLGRVLDFGCGVGRVLRYWRGRPEVELHGTDLNADAIAWDRENLKFAQFTTNTLEARLDYPDGFFGFTYALSVFTHLPVAMQLPWLAELLRIVRPGGYVYFTTHGHSYRKMLTPEMLASYDSGALVVGGDENPGSNYCGAFHPPEYVRENMLKPLGATLIEFVPEGAAGNPTQDSWLIRKAS